MKDKNFQLVYEHFIAPFEKSSKKNLKVGMEFEFPLYPKNGEVSLPALVGIFESLEKDGFQIDNHSHDHNPIWAKDALGEYLSFDSSYLNFEFSTCPQANISLVKNEFMKNFALVESYFQSKGYEFYFNGINDFTIKNKNSYRILRKHNHVCHTECEFLKSLSPEEEVFNLHPYLFTFVSSMQCHFVQTPEKLPALLNLLFDLDFIVLLLFANSPMKFKGKTYTHGRYALYNASGFGKIGATGTRDTHYKTIDDVVNDYLSRPLTYTVKNGEPEFFPPCTLGEYLSHEENQENFDFDWFFSYKTAELSYFGTIEHRIIDAQPRAEIFAPSAFLYGLTADIEKSQGLINELKEKLFKGKTNSQLCEMASSYEGVLEFLETALPKELMPLLDLAKENTPLCDQSYLDPLFKRKNLLHSPAFLKIQGENEIITL